MKLSILAAAAGLIAGLSGCETWEGARAVVNSTQDLTEEKTSTRESWNTQKDEVSVFFDPKLNFNERMSKRAWEDKHPDFVDVLTLPRDIQAKYMEELRGQHLHTYLYIKRSNAAAK